MKANKSDFAILLDDSLKNYANHTPVNDIRILLDLLAKYKGQIVSTASLDHVWIQQARASGRMYVDENGLGYVWEPISKFPTTDEEVELFEKWFPIEFKVPESLSAENIIKWVRMKEGGKDV